MDSKMKKDVLNKIICVDSLEFMRGLSDNEVDLILTDPPYNIGINKMNFVKSGRVKSGVAYRNDYTTISTEWDNNPLRQEYFDEMRRVSKNQIIFGAEHLCIFLPPSRGWIVWDKRVDNKYSNDFADCEMAWTSFEKPSRVYRYLWSGMLQKNMRLKEKRVHPTQKPVAVGRWILEKYTCGDELILDPFAGSGSFLLACKQKGFDFIGCEINREYVKIIEKRLTQENLNFFM